MKQAVHIRVKNLNSLFLHGIFLSWWLSNNAASFSWTQRDVSVLFCKCQLHTRYGVCFNYNFEAISVTGDEYLLKSRSSVWMEKPRHRGSHRRDDNDNAVLDGNLRNYPGASLVPWAHPKSRRGARPVIPLTALKARSKFSTQITVVKGFCFSI